MDSISPSERSTSHQKHPEAPRRATSEHTPTITANLTPCAAYVHVALAALCPGRRPRLSRADAAPRPRSRPLHACASSPSRSPSPTHSLSLSSLAPLPAPARTSSTRANWSFGFGGRRLKKLSGHLLKPSLGIQCFLAIFPNPLWVSSFLETQY